MPDQLTATWAQIRAKLVRNSHERTPWKTSQSRRTPDQAPAVDSSSCQKCVRKLIGTFTIEKARTPEEKQKVAEASEAVLRHLVNTIVREGHREIRRTRV